MPGSRIDVLGVTKQCPAILLSEVPVVEETGPDLTFSWTYL